MTSGAALYVADIATSLEEGVEISLQSINERTGLKKIEQLVSFSKSL